MKDKDERYYKNREFKKKLTSLLRDAAWGKGGEKLRSPRTPTPSHKGKGKGKGKFSKSIVVSEDEAEEDVDFFDRSDSEQSD